MRFFGISLMGSLFFSFLALAQISDVGLPDTDIFKEVEISPDHVFVPKGFDSNDNSEVVVTGWYPNPCYEWSHSQVSKNALEVDVHLKAFLKDGADVICIAMAVPYMESIRLGNMPEGKSEIRVGNIKAPMDIVRANGNSIDDYLYGQVRSVRAKNGQLILDIERPSDCIELDRFQWVFNGEDVCSVLPIMKRVKDFCPREAQLDTYSNPIPQECTQAPKTLLHVRSLEGKAVNYLLRNRNPI